MGFVFQPAERKHDRIFSGKRIKRIVTMLNRRNYINSVKLDFIKPNLDKLNIIKIDSTKLNSIKMKDGTLMRPYPKRCPIHKHLVYITYNGVVSWKV